MVILSAARAAVAVSTYAAATTLASVVFNVIPFLPRQIAQLSQSNPLPLRIASVQHQSGRSFGFTGEAQPIARSAPKPFDCRTGRETHQMPACLIVYFPLADPAVPTAFLDLYADAGVDIVEFGWPSPSPYRDGPDVRASMARASGADPLAALVAARQ